VSKNTIKPLPIVNIGLDKSAMTYLMNIGQKISVPAYTFYIEGPETHILVDTGCPAELGRKYWVEPVEDIKPFDEALSSLGLKPEDIDIVIHTQLHWDHVGNTARCAKAKLIVHEAELAFARNPHPYLPGPYQPELYRDLNFQTVRGGEEIAEGVKLLFTPGHSPGGLSVAVQTSRGNTIIAGLCTIKDNFYPPPEVRTFFPEAMTPGIHTNAVEAYDSLIKIKKIADVVLPLHEKSLEDKY